MKKNSRMRLQILIIFMVVPLFVFGQNKSLNIGFNNNGINIGNSIKSNGLRLNFWDKNVNTVNGLNIAVKSSSKKTNGINIGLLYSNNENSNGLQLALTYIYGKKINGLSIGGMGVVGADTINGIAIGAIGVGAEDSNVNGFVVSGIGVVGAKLNGVFIGMLGASNWSKHAKKVNGVALGFVWGVKALKFNGIAVGISNSADIVRGILIGLSENYSKRVNGIQLSIYNKTEVLNGIQIGVYNKSEKGNGVQFGILNKIEGRKRFKTLPLINFSFKRKTSR